MRPDDRPEHGSQSTAGDRLIGLGMILGGLVGLGVVYLLWRFAPASMPVPPGLPRNLLPIVSPLNCVLPLTAIGSTFLVLLGLKRLLIPD